MDKRNPSIDYWLDFYSKPHTTEPTAFARWVKPQLTGSVVDLGCGNGRDTDYLGAVGVDSAVEKYKGDAISPPPADNYYARFFFHAIIEGDEDKLLNRIHGTLYAESRAEGDDSFVDDHYRRLIDPNKFTTKLLGLGYSLIYLAVSRGLAEYKGEDPLIFRIVAKR